MKSTIGKKKYSFKKTGRKLTRYDEFTGIPYEIDETELVEDPKGAFVMETIYGPRFTFGLDGKLIKESESE